MDPKTAMITGGGRGIGRAIAECLAEKDIQIAIIDINGRLASETASAIQKEFGVKTLGLTCDIARQDQVEASVRKTKEHFGEINILVNNAGICPFVEIMEITEETFRRTVDVNLIGAFLVTQAVGKVMIEQDKGGKIIFITSLAVDVTSSAQVDYAASKAGLNMLMKGFAVHLGRYGIACNAVAPGIIYTDMGREYWDKPENQEFIKHRVPLGRIGYPRDVGQAVSLLVSDEATYINGVSLTVDGGQRACNV